MLRHVAMFRWSESAGETERMAVESRLASLPSLIPEIADYRFGHDIGLSPGNRDFVVVADFASVDDYLSYRDHPAHRAVIEDVILPIVSERGAIQFDLGT